MRHVRRLIRRTRAIKPSSIEIILAVEERQLFFSPNISQCLEDYHVSSADASRPCVHVWPAVAVDESRPVAGLLGVDVAFVHAVCDLKDV